jgi:hypothetical protein
MVVLGSGVWSRFRASVSFDGWRIFLVLISLHNRGTEMPSRRLISTREVERAEAIVFFYRIENTTAYDYRFPRSITMMSRDHDGVDVQDEFVLLDNDVCVPANSAIKIRVHYPSRWNLSYLTSDRSQTPESRKDSGIYSISDLEPQTKQQKLASER